MISEDLLCQFEWWDKCAPTLHECRLLEGHNGPHKCSFVNCSATNDEGSEKAISDSANADGVPSVTVDEMLSWKDELGRKAFEAFGRRGAHVSESTYEHLRRLYRIPVIKTVFTNDAVVHLNSFKMHVAEGVPDGVLVPCDCEVNS